MPDDPELPEEPALPPKVPRDVDFESLEQPAAAPTSARVNKETRLVVRIDILMFSQDTRGGATKKSARSSRNMEKSGAISSMG